jgi:hypothetical protein
MTCTQNGSTVLHDASTAAGYGAYFTLGPTPSWTGGSAVCTTQLVKYAKSGAPACSISSRSSSPPEGSTARSRHPWDYLSQKRERSRHARMQPDDVYRLTAVDPPVARRCHRRLRPDLGRRERARSTQRIWAVPADGSAPPRRLTFGGRACSPRWSPDGRWLAFTSAATTTRRSCSSCRRRPGESRQLTSLKVVRSTGSTGRPTAPGSRSSRAPTIPPTTWRMWRSVHPDASRGCSSGWTTRDGRRVARTISTRSASTGRSPCS